MILFPTVEKEAFKRWLSKRMDPNVNRLSIRSQITSILRFSRFTREHAIVVLRLEKLAKSFLGKPGWVDEQRYRARYDDLRGSCILTSVIREIIMAVIARELGSRSSSGDAEGCLGVTVVVVAARRDTNGSKGRKRKDALPLHPRQIYHRLAVMCVMNFRLSLD